MPCSKPSFRPQVLTKPFILSFLLLCLASQSQASWQAQYHLSSQWQQQGQDEPLPLPMADSPWLGSQHLSLIYQQQGLYAHLRWQQPDLEQGGELVLPELYYDADLPQQDAWALSLGAKHWQWDYQYAYSPLNWLGFAPQSSKLPLAQPMVLLEHFAASSVWQLGCTLQDSPLCLARSEWFGQQWDGQLLLGYQQGWQSGLAGQWLATDALNLRASLMWQESYQWQEFSIANSHSWLSQPPWIERNDSNWQGVLGATFSTGNGWQLIAEHGYQQRALSAEDWQQLLALAAWQQQQGEHPAKAGNQLWLAQASLQTALSQHQSLVRLSYQQGDWQPYGWLQLHWLEQPSYLLEIGNHWQWNSQASIQLAYRYHDAQGPLATLGQQVRLALELTTF